MAAWSRRGRGWGEEGVEGVEGAEGVGVRGGRVSRRRKVVKEVKGHHSLLSKKELNRRNRIPQQRLYIVLLGDCVVFV
jgi:hypothetical protein